MDCLKGYIGLKGQVEIPESGLYINSLAGITSDMLDRIRETEDEVYGVWEDVQTVAATRLYTDSLVQLKTGYNLFYLLEGEEMTLPADETCTYESIICNNKKLFTSVWLFLLGNQICIEVLATSRHNQHTTTDREKIEQLRDFYQAEYEKNLKLVITSLCIESQKCLKCGGEIKHVPWLP